MHVVRGELVQDLALEKERTTQEAHDMCLALKAYVEVAFEYGASPAQVNAYLRQVRDFMFRVRVTR